MTNTSGITYEGQPAKDLFMLLTGAVPGPQGRRGDLLLENHLVSVRKANKTTVNQVRAVRYQPLVVFDPSATSWYVVPPNEVVQLVTAKSRGQHCANTYETQTLSLRNLGNYQLLNFDSLRARTLAAVVGGENRAEIRDAMLRVRQNVETLATQSMDMVRPLV